MAADRMPPRRPTVDPLPQELRALGRALDVPPTDADVVAAAVLARIADEPVPAQSGWTGRARARVGTLLRDRRRAALVALGGLLVALLLTPPVRATVADWFGLGGVVFRPGPTVPSASAPPSATGGMTLEEAADLVRFTPVVPRALGAPDGVEVGSRGRLLSLTWDGPDGTRRLDEFDGRLEPMFVKTVGRQGAEYVEVDDEYALWFPEPHEVVLLDDSGRERTESARPAGPTLVWQSGGVTLRLEGVPDKRRAIEIAESGTR